MSENFNIEIITPERIFYQKSYSVTIPSFEGEMTILQIIYLNYLFKARNY